MAKQPNVAELTERLQQESAQVAFLTERLAELELSLEDTGWLRLVQGAEREFSRDGLRRIIAFSRLMYLKNPLVNRAVNVQAYYVWGQGVNVAARNAAINDVVQAFLDDRKNKAELTSHQARMLKECELAAFGNLFFVFFVNQATGRVRMRSIPVDEVVEIVTNPEDTKDPWYYKRQWTSQALNVVSGAYETKSQIAYYPDWQYDPTDKPKTIGGYPVMWESPVYHVKVGSFGDMRFGVPETYQALDWARAYKDFLEDRSTVARALARFAWRVVAPGGKAGIQAAKAKLGTTIGGGNVEGNPPPVTGSVFVAGANGATLDPIRTSGATINPEEGRRLLLMVASAVGLPETFFGDASTGSLATAKSLDRPTQLKFADRQTLWGDVFSDILEFVILWAVRAPGGALHTYGEVLQDDDGTMVWWGTDAETGKPIDPTVDVTFPDILEADKVANVNAIVEAATLGGKPSVGTIDDRTLVRLLLAELGVDDVDELLDKIAPEGGESLMAQLQRQKQEQAQAIADRQAQAAQAKAERQAKPGQQGRPPSDDAATDQSATEAAMIEAVRELRQAVARVIGD